MKVVKLLDNTFSIDTSSSNYIKAVVENVDLGIKVRCFYPIGTHHDYIIEHLSKAVYNIANLSR